MRRPNAIARAGASFRPHGHVPYTTTTEAGGRRGYPLPRGFVLPVPLPSKRDQRRSGDVPSPRSRRRAGMPSRWRRRLTASWLSPSNSAICASGRPPSNRSSAAVHEVPCGMAGSSDQLLLLRAAEDYSSGPACSRWMWHHAISKSWPLEASPPRNRSGRGPLQRWSGWRTPGTTPANAAAPASEQEHRSHQHRTHSVR